MPANALRALVGTDSGRARVSKVIASPATRTGTVAPTREEYGRITAVFVALRALEAPPVDPPCRPPPYVLWLGIQGEALLQGWSQALTATVAARNQFAHRWCQDRGCGVTVGKRRSGGLSRGNNRVSVLFGTVVAPAVRAELGRGQAAEAGLSAPG